MLSRPPSGGRAYPGRSGSLSTALEIIACRGVAKNRPTARVPIFDEAHFAEQQFEPRRVSQRAQCRLPDFVSFSVRIPGRQKLMLCERTLRVPGVRERKTEDAEFWEAFVRRFS